MKILCDSPMNNTTIFDECTCNICIEYKLLNDSFNKRITKSYISTEQSTYFKFHHQKHNCKYKNMYESISDTCQQKLR